MTIGKWETMRFGSSVRWAFPAILLAVLTLGMTATGSADAARLSVSPATAQIGPKRCFTFTASQSGKRLKGKLVRFAGRAAHTGPRGRARICARLRWTGRHGALLSLRGKRKRWVTVRATANRGVTTIGGEWHKFVVNVPAWGDTGDCIVNAQWGDGTDVWCGAPATGAGTAPFELGKYTLFLWTRNKTDIGVTMRSWYFVDGSPSKKQVFNNLWGWVPAANSGAYYVNAAQLPEIGASDVKTGTDPAREGLQGGPLHIDVISHRKPFGDSAYNFYVAGYLFY